MKDETKIIVGELELDLARSHIAPGTGSYRDFSYIAPDIPHYIASNCTACMECVTECPDTAILAKVLPEEQVEAELAKIEDEETRERMRAHFAKQDPQVLRRPPEEG